MDYYNILGVDKSASADEIKSAYRKLASKNHPDKGGSKERFQEIQQAYDTLGDSQRRQHYDAYGNQPQHGPQHGPGGFHFEFGPDIFNDLFQQFGFRAGPQQRQRQAYSAMVVISLEQVAHGGQKTLQLNFPQGQKILDINIPRGINDGEQVRYDNIIPDVSIIIQFRVAQHPIYNRHGLDLHRTHAVSVFHLITGTTLTLMDIYGRELEIVVPPKTKIGATLRCSGRGLAADRGVGDLYVLLSAHIPDTISDELAMAINKEVKGI